MKNDNKDGTNDSALRKRAEERLRISKAEKGIPLNDVDNMKLIHELQVHQIELEMQNEELMQARAEIEKSLEKYFDLYNFAPAGYFTITEKGIIVEVNLKGAALLGETRQDLINRSFELFVSEIMRPIFASFLRKVFDSNTIEKCDVALHPRNHTQIYLHMEGTPIIASTNNPQQCRISAIDITKLKQAESERELLISKLNQALSEVKSLSGLLPICSYCKRIRDDKGYWSQLESYLESHSDVMFSHCVCPRCLKKHYPEVDEVQKS
jgi:PAS domain S-box-containing protein